ncbi:MAG TPA: MarR family transcriptional regulator [Terriglobales bacterium]|nr:MarR family transcriptional regulator [Terriglobales bacterium]
MAKQQNKNRHTGLRQRAIELEQHLRAIQQQIRRPLQAEFAKGGLTGPQKSVLHVLVQSDGRSIKEITAHVGLAHSTVSGIVDRLQKRGFVQRQTDPHDRRHTRITVSTAIRDFMNKEYPVLAARPLFDALRKAAPEERESIVRGVTMLRKLLA